MDDRYSNSEHKFKAREENVRLYREMTGRKSLPPDREYWTLCAIQPDTDMSEINQMVASGLIKKEQYVGVDWDCEGEGIIAKNRKVHPEATWIKGEWVSVIRKVKRFNPGMIYLDTTSFADHKQATRLVVETMMRCPSDTLLLTNVMMNDPRSHRKFTGNVLIENIGNQIPPSELGCWNHRVKNYVYSMTGITDMATFALYKRG